MSIFVGSVSSLIEMLRRLADILQDEKDPFYRYKMERLQSKIEGKGNGIKTVIVNLSSVAQSLSRPPSCAYSVPKS